MTWLPVRTNKNGRNAWTRQTIPANSRRALNESATAASSERLVEAQIYRNPRGKSLRIS
jgi:hypothetical protein